MTRLINRNVQLKSGRTSLRMEKEMWEGLEDMAEEAQEKSISKIIDKIECAKGERTSSVRSAVVVFYRDKSKAFRKKKSKDKK